MKTTLICAALGACAACGTPDTPPKPEAATAGPQVDLELQPFVDDFLQECETRRTDCTESLNRIKSIRVTEIPDINTKDDEVVIGLCYDNIFNRRIEINKEIIGKSYTYIRVLVYHELGHCAYDLDHDKDPKAIMAANMPDMWVIIKNWEDMVMDLFGAIQQKHGD